MDKMKETVIEEVQICARCHEPRVDKILTIDLISADPSCLSDTAIQPLMHNLLDNMERDVCESLLDILPPEITARHQGSEPELRNYSWRLDFTSNEKACELPTPRYSRKLSFNMCTACWATVHDAHPLCETTLQPWWVNLRGCAISVHHLYKSVENCARVGDVEPG